VQSGITARIKILSNLKIDEHMVPQDGRFKIQVQDEKLSFRVSIIPVYDGEKIVMRLLHEGQKPLSLDELGFLTTQKKLLETAMQKPHGMILVTGPTGSGKTTTLYSVLGMLNKPEVNISTIEDPIEYHVAGINQSQVNTRAGFSFASGLRAFLRQDPNVIMVGEIRDAETAEIAIHAAMTGHLVLSTLHTNDAPTTLPRLLEMGIPPFLVAFTANIIIAQRLVRKICEHCKKEFHLEKAAIIELEKAFNTDKISALFKAHEITLKAEEKNLNSMIFYRGEGCSRCGNSGYKGRMGIYEVLDVDKDLANKINARATADDIKTYAIEHGMVTMLQDGLIKAKRGITTIEEVLRVSRD
jgi:type IV pilus assembly protein PilB